MGLQASFRSRRGFALPTVLIASVVLLTVLAVSVTATTAARNALKDQYYAQLAQVAGEAGIAYAEACLQASSNVVTWSNANPLTPATDCNGVSNLQPTVSALIVGGGGGGGAGGGGGGGGGGVRYVPSMVVSAQAYTVTTGAGGTYSNSSTVKGSDGGSSSFNGITVAGGGGGASRDGGLVAGNGSSGGGGAGTTASGARDVAGTGTAGQGFAGGNGTAADLGCNAAGGGGGGAASSGQAASSAQPGSGGMGYLSFITGSAAYYGHGGGGGNACSTGNQAATIIGGPSPVYINPTNYRGGGGNGGNTVYPPNYTQTTGAASGARGAVYISYPQNSGITATGGTISYANGRVIHMFTASSSTFTVTSATPTCPNSIGCYVESTGTVRSSFSVPAPDVDADGRPTTIPMTGYVDVVRNSSGAVWRTYRQPATQPAVVPALCSGASRSDLGWGNAVATTLTGTFPSTTARPINITSGNSLAGRTHFRKDFSIAEAGTYTIQVKGDDTAQLYLDGAIIASTTSYTDIATVNITLTPGCHSLQAVVTNQSYNAGLGGLIMSMKRQNTTQEVIVTDTSWRVAAGTAVDFSRINYHQTPAWSDVRVISAYNGAPFAAPSDWVTSSNDTGAQWINANTGYTGTDYVANSYTYFRTKDNNSWRWAGVVNLQVKLSLSCDNACVVYINGEPVLESTEGSAVTANTTVELGDGQHSVGIRLYNGGASPNTSGVLFSATNVDTGLVLDNSGSGWVATEWFGSPQTLQSYEENYAPSPDIDECHCETQGATNLIINPSVETNLTGYSGNLMSVTRSTAAERDGDYGVLGQVTSVGALPDVRYSTSEIMPGRRYKVSAYINTTVDTQIGYRFYDAYGANLVINSSSGGWYSTTNPGGAFTRISFTTPRIPAQARSMIISIKIPDNSAVGTQIYVDSLMMTAGETLYEYRDGTYTADGWSWFGGAHGSVSRGPAVTP